ncbi:MAG: S9 family peptidase [Chitinophagales bacterium]|nr:S9 family peptidase [Chitinophagales bacterium]MDW8392820.1 S9 family peptidase [Chitinophagales bacterium]
MKNIIHLALGVALLPAAAQTPLTIEQLWSLGRVTAETVSADRKHVVYGVTYTDLKAGKNERNLYAVPIDGGAAVQLTTTEGTESNVVVTPSGKMGYLYNGHFWEADWDGKNARQITRGEGGITAWKFSPDGKYVAFSREVKVDATWKDRYPDLTEAKAYVADDLMYRHWDQWKDGRYNHVFVASYYQGEITDERDIMAGEPYDCPQRPFGGADDFLFTGDASAIIYVCKKKSGKDYAISTNTSLYYYGIATGKTENLTPNLPGYDVAPALSPNGMMLAWLSMARDGYESDKNNIIIKDLYGNGQWNITKNWDETIDAFRWSSDGKKIYFTAPVQGAQHLFEIALPANLNGFAPSSFRQITQGRFDVVSLLDQVDNWMIAVKTDMNRAAEVVRIDLTTGAVLPVTSVNDEAYSRIKPSRIDEVWITTTDKKKMLTYVIYPPDFDSNKKYPALLYCQGGPQSPITQFYSFRWNFQLMAAHGYIVIAPSRRGMPGFGVAWNEQISGDWGGQAMHDYLSAVDSITKWRFVDKSRVGAIGASFGGYSAYLLAGIHQGRFKTFIAHNGVFNLKSMYNATEEIWFTNHDLGGAWWKSPPPQSYETADPMNYVNNWNTPMLLTAGQRDYRIPYVQSLEAFQVLQLKGIKSRLIVFPEEGHWILRPHNSILWQREFYRWLKETL